MLLLGMRFYSRDEMWLPGWVVTVGMISLYWNKMLLTGWDVTPGMRCHYREGKRLWDLGKHLAMSQCLGKFVLHQKRYINPHIHDLLPVSTLWFTHKNSTSLHTVEFHTTYKIPRSRPYLNSIAKMKFASINSEGNGTYKLNHNMPVLTRQYQIGHQKMQLLHDFPDILHSLMNKQTALTINNLGKCRCGLTPCICGGYPSTTKAKGPKCRCGMDPCICGFRELIFKNNKKLFL